MAYKSNKEFEELDRISDLNSKASLFLDNCMYVANQSCIPLKEGDREKFYSWSQIVLRELAKLESETLDTLLINYREANSTDGLSLEARFGPLSERKVRHIDPFVDKDE